MAQPGEDPAAHQEHRQLRAAFVLGPIGTRRDDHRLVMGGEFFVRALQLRLIAVGAGDADPRVIRHEDRRGRPVILQRPHVACEPVRQLLSARGFRISAAAGAHGTHEQLRTEGLLAAAAVDRHRAAGVINEQLLAGKMPLAHRALQAPLPAPVDLAKGAAPVGGGAVRLCVLLPQQLQHHVAVALELLVDPRAVRCHERPGLRRRRRPEHPPLQLGLRQALRFGRRDPGRPHRRRYFETAPIDSPSARESSRTLKLLACSPISCFNFDMEILSFGIDCVPLGQNPQGYAVRFSIISSRRLRQPRS